MKVKISLMRTKKIFTHFRKNTANNLTFNVELVNGDLDAVVDKLGVHKEIRQVVIVVVYSPAGRSRVGIRRCRKRAR